ncbi:hypothetical protein [Halococcus sp. AFM35]|uniref:hypothetical protein n=1 Tax=Halococcus sp. AFM35 TaxID=3421653 RepID=UPI003EB894E2
MTGSVLYSAEEADETEDERRRQTALSTHGHEVAHEQAATRGGDVDHRGDEGSPVLRAALFGEKPLEGDDRRSNRARRTPTEFMHAGEVARP